MPTHCNRIIPQQVRVNVRIGNNSRKVHINAAFGFGIVLEVTVPSGLSLYLSGAPPSDGATILLFLKVLACVMTSSSLNSWNVGSGTFGWDAISPSSELHGRTSVMECASLSFGGASSMWPSSDSVASLFRSCLSWNLYERPNTIRVEIRLIPRATAVST